MTAKEERDIAVVGLMIELYCRRKHKTPKGSLCEECAQLYDYVKLRRSKCPFGDGKPSCSHCKIHCYKPSMQEKIRRVMKFSGPRLVIYRPSAAFRHLFTGYRPKGGAGANVGARRVYAAAKDGNAAPAEKD